MENVGDVAADHAIDEHVGGGAFEIGESFDVAAIAEHGGGVADSVDLFHPMRHVENHAALGAQALDDGEKFFDLAAG